MHADRAKGAILDEILVDALGVEDVTTGHLPDNGDSVFESVQAYLAFRLVVGGGSIDRTGDARAFTSQAADTSPSEL